MRKKRIWMISGDPVICELIQHSLKEYAIDIFYTTGEFESCNRIAKNGYCLTIMDIRFSVVRETEMLCMMREMSYAPILVLTEDCSTENQIAFLRMGADVCVGKPIDVNLCIAQADALVRLYNNAKVCDSGSIWNMDFALNGDETVRVHIKTLRKKLAQTGEKYIYNVWGSGYKFVPPGVEDYSNT